MVYGDNQMTETIYTIESLPIFMQIYLFLDFCGGSYLLLAQSRFATIKYHVLLNGDPKGTLRRSEY